MRNRIAARGAGAAGLTAALLILVCPITGAAPPPTGAAGIPSDVGAPELGPSVALPQSVDGWTRPEEPETYDAASIFDYMNGGAELYTGYRFGRLDVYEYASPQQQTIVVELYWLESSDDAFGLLSIDRRGEPVDLTGRDPEIAHASDSPAGPGKVGPAQVFGSEPRARYTSGLLQMWADNLYARVMAYRETEAAKRAVFSLGASIAAGRDSPDPPALVRAVPPNVGTDYRLGPGGISFVRSQVALNAVDFFSSENVFDLTPSVDGVNASYEPVSAESGPASVRLMIFAYASAEAADRAVRRFRKSYPPETEQDVEAAARDCGFFEAESGWTAYTRSGRNLAVITGSPDLEAARRFAETISTTIGGSSD